MAQEVADHILSRLREWNIRHVSAYPGDGINGLVAAFGRANDDPRFVQARHEEMAAFEATRYAKFSGRVGIYGQSTLDTPLRKLIRTVSRFLR